MKWSSRDRHFKTIRKSVKGSKQTTLGPIVLTASDILRDIQEDEDVTWQESCSSEDMVQRVILEALEADEEDGDVQYLLQMAKEHSVSAYHSQQGIENGDEGDDEEAEGMRPAVLLTKTVNILTWL